MAPSLSGLWIWRHPRPLNASGLCIGQTDLGVDKRRAKRLAFRILDVIRREQLPRQIWTSPLARGALVGQALARYGIEHRMDWDLAELNFGQWEGRYWSDISRSEFSAWERDFTRYAPGGGESVFMLIARVRAFLQRAPNPCMVVGHAGWINSLEYLDGKAPTADRWPASVNHGHLRRWPALADNRIT